MVKLKPLSTIPLLFIAVVMAVAGCAGGADERKGGGYILLAATTSAYDSGLLGYLVPVFTEETGIEVRILSRGTGQALELGRRGEVDVLLVHDRPTELQLVEEGFFTDRYDCMYNDFILVGPPDDPAGIRAKDSVLEALAALAEGDFTFISRGDDSGTHRLELNLWELAGINPGGNWYLSVGSGMSDALKMADEKKSYILADRGTYASMKHALDLVILLEGDPLLFNQYGIMAVNPDKYPHVRYEQALRFIEFFMSEKGQSLITGYKVEGEALFFPGYGLE